ncbi:unnamed protein product [Hymenolepis diminuta]|uniref:Uncharacterized protein n=1 Tax=Hymenolepis diminuta TaxID=6216 RepID=A0A158QFU2_HYMDI|nr:unnamed protein product [Hymenolepis diminuta]
MDTGASICTNGVNIQNVNKKESLMQRIKNQQSTLNVLEQRYSEASNQHDAILEQIRRKSSDSEKLISSLQIRTHQNIRELKNYLYPSCLNDHSVASPSLKVTPTPGPPLHNIDLSMPPPNDPLPNSSSSLKRPRNTSSISTSTDFTQIPVDPAVELVLNRFLQSLRSSETQIASNRAELQRCKFTEDSQNGKRMMSRLRVLEKENAELETLRESGRPAKVANLMALRGRHLARFEKLLDDAESEVEVFTNTLTMLQQQLSLATATIEVLAVALANCSPSSGAKSAVPSSPSAYQRCIELLQSSDWPIPESLRECTTAATSASPQQQNNDGDDSNRDNS